MCALFSDYLAPAQTIRVHQAISVVATAINVESLRNLNDFGPVTTKVLIVVTREHVHARGIPLQPGDDDVQRPTACDAAGKIDSCDNLKHFLASNHSELKVAAWLIMRRRVDIVRMKPGRKLRAAHYLSHTTKL